MASLNTFNTTWGDDSMEAILAYAGAHWLEWLCTCIAALAGLGYKNLSKRLKEEKIQNKAIAEGVQSLLRENIVNSYNKYSDRGYCPIYAKDSIKKLYTAYHNLGGNDVATSLYKKILEMHEEKPEQEKNRFEDDGK